MIDFTTSKWSDKALAFIRKPIEDFKKITLLYGAVRSSKTVNVDIKFLDYIKYINGRGTIAIIGVTKDTVYDNILTDLFDIVGQKNYKFNRQTGDLLFYGKYKCKVIGAKDKGSEKFLRGKTLAGALIDELTLIPPDFFKQLINRCSIPGSKIFATTNPDSPDHWLYKDFIINPAKAGIFEAWHFLLTDNLNLDPQYIEDLKLAYSGVFAQRMIDGLFVVAEGLVISEYDSSTHLFDTIDYDDYKEIICGIDFGFSNPSAVGIWGVTRDNKFDLLFEFYKTGCITKDLITWIRDKEQIIYKACDKKVRFIFPDPAEPDRAAEIQQAGYYAYPADNSILSGLNCVKTLFKNNKIRIHRSCVNIQNECATLRWPDENEPGFGDDRKFVGADHAVDSMRYVLYTYVKKLLGYKI